MSYQLFTALGAQDEWISGGEPSNSFFSAVYKRHTPFSQCVEKQKIYGKPVEDGLSRIVLERHGDLVGYTYFTVEQGGASVTVNDWTRLIKEVSIVIGGQKIDTMTSDFTERIAVDMFARNVSKSSNGPHGGGVSMFYPLRFWWNEDVKNALPLCAMKYSEAELHVRWGPDADQYTWSCFSNYYYLSDEEREQLTNNELNMLITQTQKNIGGNERVQELTFSHPVKFIASSNTASTSALRSLNNRIKIAINGTDLNGGFRHGRPHFMEAAHYFHTQNVTSPDVFMYSFCNNTSDENPCGSLNCSRISSFRIYSETDPIVDTIYASSWNILRAKNGIAAQLYSN